MHPLHQYQVACECGWSRRQHLVVLGRARELSSPIQLSVPSAWPRGPPSLLGP